MPGDQVICRHQYQAGAFHDLDPKGDQPVQRCVEHPQGTRRGQQRVRPVPGADDGAFAVQLAVSAYDRRGLLRDLTDVLAVERLSIDAVTSRTDHEVGIAYFALTVGVNDLEQLARVLRRLAAVPNVIEARRQQ